MHRTRPPDSRSGLIRGHTALQKLHWLPVKYRVTFKIATIMHQTFHHRCPSMTLSCLLRPTRMYSNFAPSLLEPLPSNEAGRRSEGVPSQWPAPTYGTVFLRPSVPSTPAPSLRSCPQDTSVPLSIWQLVFTLTLTLYFVINNRSILICMIGHYNFYDVMWCAYKWDCEYYNKMMSELSGGKFWHVVKYRFASIATFWLR